MTKEEKQIELLNRQYTNIEHYKSLRIRIPTMFGGILLGLTGYVLNSNFFAITSNEKLLFAFALMLLGAFGIITYRFIHSQYNDIVDDIHYLWKKLKMEGEDFFDLEKGIGNKKVRAPKMFGIGYISILLFTIIGIVSIFIK